MREIKFRAWDLDDKQFYTPVITQTGKSADLWYGYEVQGELEDPLMQYTGLKDKNEVEIYEGDIVNFGSTLVEISWNEAEGCFWGGSQSQRYILQWADQIKVIGNIYQNTEILED